MVENLVNQLDTRIMRETYRGGGSLAFPPELMLKMVLFEYLQGRTSPAKWFADAGVHDAMKWLGRGIQPKRTAWYDFRDRMAKVIDELNARLIRAAIHEGLATPEAAAQDGTTFRSNASRHRAFNKATLDKRKARLDATIAAEGRHDSAPHDSTQPKWMPPTSAGRLDLQTRMETALEVLHARLLKNQQRARSERRPEKNIVVSLTDPYAPFGRDKEKTYCFLYTSQFMVDQKSLLVLGYSTAQENTDAGTLAPMIDRVQTLVGGTLKQVSVDAGYTSLLDLKDCQERNINLLGPVQSNSFTTQKQSQKKKTTKQISKDQFIWLTHEQTLQCPAGHKMTLDSKERCHRYGDRCVITNRYRCPAEHCLNCGLKDQCTTNPSAGRTVKRLEEQHILDEQCEKMKQDHAQEAYRQRGQTIERAFADAKRHRSFTRFHGRGLSRAQAEVGLLVLAQNLLATHRLRRENNQKQAT